MDWDDETFTNWGIPYKSAIVALVCQVKTGKYDEEAIERAFRPARIREAVRRIGILQTEDAAVVLDELNRRPIGRVVLHGPSEHNQTPMSNAVFAKVLIASKRCNPTRNRERALGAWSHFRINLEAAERFIVNRMANYRDEKNAARMFFPDELVQYLAWKQGVDVPSSFVECSD